MTVTYTAATMSYAARRCAELHRQRPSWPRARVRRVVAAELHVRTSTLRYLLRQAAAQAQPPPGTDPLPLVA